MVPPAAIRWHSGLRRTQCGVAESTVDAVGQSRRHVDGIINVCVVDRTDTALCQQLALLGWRNQQRKNMTIYFYTTNGYQDVCSAVCSAAVSRNVQRAGRKCATGSGAKLHSSLILTGRLSEVVELCYVLNKWRNYCVLFENMLTMPHKKKLKLTRYKPKLTWIINIQSVPHNKHTPSRL